MSGTLQVLWSKSTVSFPGILTLKHTLVSTYVLFNACSIIIAINFWVAWQNWGSYWKERQRLRKSSIINVKCMSLSYAKVCNKMKVSIYLQVKYKNIESHWPYHSWWYNSFLLTHKGTPSLQLAQHILLYRFLKHNWTTGLLRTRQENTKKQYFFMHI